MRRWPSSRLGWYGSWTPIRSALLRLHLTVDLSNLNLPRPYFWRDGDGEGRALYLFGIRHGNGNSDPVWSIDFEVTR